MERVALEVVKFELLLPKPTRAHDGVDLAARHLFLCPTCGARLDTVCAWAEPRVTPSWCAHTSRRTLCTPAELQRYRAITRGLRRA